MFKQNMKRKIRKNLKGFSLVEMILAVFIFTIAMTAITGVFGNFFKNFQKTKLVQRNVESANFAMNQMAKTIRTSKVIFPLPSSFPMPYAVLFDYSQGDGRDGSGKCIKYSFTGSSIQVASSGVLADSSSCIPASGFGSLSDMVQGVLVGSFDYDSTNNRMTIMLNVGNATSSSRLQTTVLLRNGEKYVEVAP